ncbi:MAG: RNA 2',3'-cyclic phosphodiesterase [Planctomycetota bacterium]|nr:RNA 2',3'-cyclic phosphodiesterase [Planctomycetota bacterium]
MTQRTFIAVDVNDGVRGCLNDRCQTLRRHSGTIAWVQPKVYHVTLNFLGALEPAQTAAVRALVDQVAAQAKPFDFRLRGLEAVPPKGRPRVVWANVIEPTGELAALQERLTLGLEGLGIPREDRIYIPHVTVARIKFTTTTKAIRADVESLAQEEFGSAQAREVIVFTSDLTPDGPVHTPAVRAALGGVGG